MSQQAPTYTDAELAALPQTAKVFDAPKLVTSEHEWLQEGYMITDNCQPKKATCVNAGIPIPNGKTLVKTKGGYDLIDEPR